jgi:hypothetical protein
MLKLTQQTLAEFTVNLRVALDSLRGQTELASQTEDVRLITRNLIEELRKDKTLANMRARVKHDDKTVFYVHNEKPSEWIQTSDFAA